MYKNKICLSCKHWNEIKSNDKFTGTCKRFPPSVKLDNINSPFDKNTTHIITEQNDGCAEHSEE
jgi:hypothetical protein